MKPHEQIELVRRRLQLNSQEMAAELRITPEWYSKIVNQKARVSDDLLLRLGDLARRRSIEITSTKPDPGPTGQSSVKAASLAAPQLVQEDEGSNYQPVLERGTRTPIRHPSTRHDCEAYLQRLLDLAAAHGDPDNFPAIMARLKKQFPLDEWEHPED